MLSLSVSSKFNGFKQVDERYTFVILWTFWLLKEENFLLKPLAMRSIWRHEKILKDLNIPIK